MDFSEDYRSDRGLTTSTSAPSGRVDRLWTSPRDLLGHGRSSGRPGNTVLKDKSRKDLNRGSVVCRQGG